MSDATLDASGAKPISRVGKIAFVTFLTLVSLGTLTVMAPFVLMQKFWIPGASMYPSLYIGDYVLATHAAYDVSLKRGEIVVFYVGHDTQRTVWVKRLIGLPGDRVAVRAGQLMINGTPVERHPVGERHVDHGFDMLPAFEETLPGGRKIEVLDALPDGHFDNFAEVTVPADHYFVMGDNRDNSYDSRAMDRLGFVARADIIGKPKFIYFSVGDRGIRLDRMGRFVN